MTYGRITPRSRNGTSGISVDTDLDATGGEIGVWIAPPDRVAAITVAVHVTGNSAVYAVECSCNNPDAIGADGTGGYWDSVDSDNETYNDDQILMITNCVTGIRVRCISGAINVCFVG